ncbi:MAG: hypothetical protein HKN27_07355 [Silicimonas sp.]|nr:hypothetical protein [Silicimonas sp.]
MLDFIKGIRSQSQEEFLADEDGGLMIFSIFIFILILLMAGTAVDVMRAENERIAHQNVSDAAALAAAKLELTADERRDIVRSHFEKAGLDDVIETIEVSEDPNDSSVAVLTRNTVPTFFMNMMGIEDLPV